MCCPQCAPDNPGGHALCGRPGPGTESIVVTGILRPVDVARARHLIRDSLLAWLVVLAEARTARWGAGAPLGIG